MGFYEELMQYYEDVFPLAPMKLHWLKALIEDTGADSLLDVGCASGELCGALVKSLEQVDGFDLDEAMVDKAKGSYKAPGLRFCVGDMLAASEVFEGGTYDVVTCFGNTFVHVQQSDLRTVFGQIKEVLNDDGVFVGQILNYDHVLDVPVTVLPPIDNDRITFERYYDGLSEERLDFRTVLKVKGSGKVYKNSIALYPLRQKALERLLKEAGFGAIRFYKNYKGEPAGGEHLPLIFVAES